MQTPARPPHALPDGRLAIGALAVAIMAQSAIGQLAIEPTGAASADAASPAAATVDDNGDGDGDDDRGRTFDVVTLTGKVVWLSDALQRALGIGTVPEARQRTLALETDDGQIVPLIEDLRARAFRSDERLRKMHVQLLVRHYRATPAIQILQVVELGEDGVKYQIDYWCDVCAIVMYETGACACCQDDNRLRRVPLTPTP